MSPSSDRSLPPGPSWRAPPPPGDARDGQPLPPLLIGKVCVMGATGLVGRALCASLEQAGIDVCRYSRGSRPGFARWDPMAGEIDVEPLNEVDAVVNLSGEDLSAGRWTSARKSAIRDSRIVSTQLLCRSLAELATPPKVLINASAVAFYGDRGEEAVSEESTPGHGFLAELCQAWESATAPAAQRGIRVVLPRLGIVLTPEGGANVRPRVLEQVGFRFDYPRLEDALEILVG
jgi:uncharacterized protein